MARKLSKPESKVLEKARTGISNAKSEPIIKSALNEVGITEEELNQGDSLYQQAFHLWEENKKEDAETSAASRDYKLMYTKLEEQFKVHREKCKLFFERDPQVLVDLNVKGDFPQKYNEFFDKIYLFYNALKTTPSLLDKVLPLKITMREVDLALNQLEELKNKRTKLEKEKAESQQMTKSKNSALIALSDWLDHFHKRARVALYEQPQLLEALGIFVRS